MFLPPATYALIERSMPIACVDFLLVREGQSGREIGLILRESPHGQVWCHLGGRILRGETIRDALLRHADDTLGVGLALGPDPQPGYVYQWFPPNIRPVDPLTAVGDDPRKHAIGLSFLVEPRGAPHPRNEALEFGWFREDGLPEPLWPGCQELFDRLLS